MDLIKALQNIIDSYYPLIIAILFLACIGLTAYIKTLHSKLNSKVKAVATKGEEKLSLAKQQERGEIESRVEQSNARWQKKYTAALTKQEELEKRLTAKDKKVRKLQGAVSHLEMQLEQRRKL